MLNNIDFMNIYPTQFTLKYVLIAQKNKMSVWQNTNFADAMIQNMLYRHKRVKSNA